MYFQTHTDKQGGIYNIQKDVDMHQGMVYDAEIGRWLYSGHCTAAEVKGLFIKLENTND